MSSSWSELGVSIVATIGGAIVFWGLWWEEHGEKEEYPSIVEFRTAKRKSKWGRWVLMFGVFIEICTAAWLAFREGGQIRQIKNNAEQIDPRNANISGMSATAIFFVKETNFNELTNWNPRRVATLSLFENGDTARSGFDTLYADNFTKNDLISLFGPFSGSREYGLRLQSFNFLALMGRESPVKAVENVNLLRLDVNFLPRGCEITGGEIELIVNNFHTFFKIPPQIDTNPPDGSPNFPYLIIATNANAGIKK